MDSPVFSLTLHVTTIYAIVVLIQIGCVKCLDNTSAPSGRRLTDPAVLATPALTQDKRVPFLKAVDHANELPPHSSSLAAFSRRCHLYVGTLTNTGSWGHPTGGRGCPKGSPLSPRLWPQGREAEHS